MLPRVSGVPPYEWVAAALETFAAQEALSRSEVCCMLLERGLARGLKDLRVLRTFPEARGSTVKTARVADSYIQPTSVSAEYAELPEALEGALLTLRTLHIGRAQLAWKVLVDAGLDTKLVDVRGWRAQIEGSASVSVVMQFATGAKLPKDALRDACDCVTGEMVMSDVLRALWASELEIEGYAPKGWSDRHRVNIGWLRFDRQIVR